MGKLYDQRTAIKTAVAAANLGLDESDIVIERQGDIMTKVNSVTAKRDGNGVAMTIESIKGTNIDPDADELEFDARLKVKLWVLPIYNQDSMPEEDIFEPLMKQLHNLEVEDGAHYYRQLKVLGFDDVLDPQFLIREIQLKSRLVII